MTCFGSCVGCFILWPSQVPQKDLQAAVDAHSVARIWRLLLDAHFVTDRSKELHLKVPVLNRSKQVFSFWHLKIQMSQSGRITGQGTFTNTRVYSSTHSWSPSDVYSVLSDIFLVVITTLHTLAVSGLLDPFVSFLLRYIRPPRDDTKAEATDALNESMSQPPSRWFQLLCQFSCAALALGIILASAVNSYVLRCDTHTLLTNCFT